MNLIDLGVIGSDVVALLPFIPVTLGLSVVAMLLGLVLGLGIALVKMARTPVLSQLIAVAVSYLRGTPVLVQLLVNVNALPIAVLLMNQAFGLDLRLDRDASSPFLIAAATFALHEAAYASETIRAALRAVDRREVEAAQSLGMTRWQELRRVTIPSAAVIAFPTLVNQFIGMLKQSSLAFLVSVIEVTAEAKILGGRDLRFFEAYLATAIIYWALTILVEQLARAGERRLEIGGAAGRRRAQGESPAGPVRGLRRVRALGAEAAA